MVKWRTFKIEILTGFDREKTVMLLRDFLTGAYRAFRIEELTEDKDAMWRCKKCDWQSDVEYLKCPQCEGNIEKFYPMNEPLPNEDR